MARKQLKDLVGQFQGTSPSPPVAETDDTDQVLQARLAQARAETPPKPSARQAEAKTTPASAAKTKPSAPSTTRNNDRPAPAKEATKRTSVSVPASTAEWIRRRSEDEHQTTGGTIMLLLRKHGQDPVWTPQQQQDRAFGINVDIGIDSTEPRTALSLSLTPVALEALDDFAGRNDLTRSEAVTWLISRSS